MSLAVVHSRAEVGIDAPAVTVEVHLANGLPSFSIVGLPETAVKESKDRVRGAILNSRFDFPARRITVNLAPADLPKEGGRFDLPIAIGILAASGQIRGETIPQHEFIGELALGGDIRRVRGALTTALATKDSQRSLILAEENAAEAGLVGDLDVLPSKHLLEVTGHLSNTATLESYSPRPDSSTLITQPDLNEVFGQAFAKRALEIAAAGGHSLLMIGPPGTGKTLLANRLPGLLPIMNEQQALETAAVYSLTQNGFAEDQWRTRPFRNPHHSASGAALVGGGSHPRPGEISLSHNGVLFLDELPEFDRRVLELLREPLESGQITISRAARQVVFPSRFQLVCAMNPCPCGYLGDASGRCHCTQDQIKRYQSRISGPLLDRIDLHVEVPTVPIDDMRKPGPHGESSADVRQRVIHAQQRQFDRNGYLDAQLSGKALEKHCNLDPPSQQLLEQATQRLSLSARGYHRILKVARTIADLAGNSQIQNSHIAEAIQYRCLDRMGQN